LAAGKENNIFMWGVYALVHDPNKKINLTQQAGKFIALRNKGFLCVEL